MSTSFTFGAGAQSSNNNNNPGDTKNAGPPPPPPAVPAVGGFPFAGAPTGLQGANNAAAPNTQASPPPSSTIGKAPAAAPGGGFNFTKAPAAPSQNAAMPNSTGLPAAGGSADTKAASNVPPAQPPPPSFLDILNAASMKRCVNDEFVRTVKDMFAKPTASPPAAAPPAPATAGAAAPASSQPQMLQTALGATTASNQTNRAYEGLFQRQPAKSVMGPLGPVPLQSSLQQPKVNGDVLRILRLKHFLALLRCCKSGLNNTQFDHVRAEEEDEDVEGLHKSVAAVAESAAVDLVQYIQRELAPRDIGQCSLPYLLRTKDVKADRSAEEPDAASAGEPSSSRVEIDNPLLLAAQALYLLTRHFQLSVEFVQACCDLVEQLLSQVQDATATTGNVHALEQFRSSPETAPTCTLLWLVTMSTVNAIGVWKKLLQSDGTLRENKLTGKKAAPTYIGKKVSDLRKKMEAKLLDKSGEGGTFYPGARHLGRGRGRERKADPKLQGDGYADGGYGKQQHRWMAIVDAFLCMLTLAEGCALNAANDEAGQRKAYEAFVGLRGDSKTTMRRGKVTKRMLQLAPLPRTLFIAHDTIYVVPYEMLSYIFDFMVPLLRTLSENEVLSCRRFATKLQDLREKESTNTYNTSATVAYMADSTGVAAINGWDANRGDENLADDASLDELEPFTSEMAHILEALALCLENLPPGVLRPDLDSNCAATFFVFENYVVHLKGLFELQEGTGVWESFILKSVCRFVEVLTMIARNPQYTERVFGLFETVQEQCPELVMSSMKEQVRECSGVSELQRQQLNHSRDGYDGTAGLVYDERPGLSQRSSLHTKYTRRYARKCQNMFITSFFMLLRQLLVRASLRAHVLAYFDLDLVLSFLLVRGISQKVLGAALSLLSGLIHTPADAVKTWGFLEMHNLLSPQRLDAAGNPERENAVELADGGVGATGDNEGQGFLLTNKELPLIAHCKFERTIGTYSVTIGFLHLIIALFRSETPSMSLFRTYSTVTHFIAREIFTGVLQRGFQHSSERFTVMALAAAALRHALLVNFVAESGEELVTHVPFTTVMATDKAPTDVLGEILAHIDMVCYSQTTLLTHQRAALRQCLRLLYVSIQAADVQGVQVLYFEKRTIRSPSLAGKVLRVANTYDVLVMNRCLELLELFLPTTMCNGADEWSKAPSLYTPVAVALSSVLEPEGGKGQFMLAPPELSYLDYELSNYEDLDEDALLAECEAESKKLLLGLLHTHAAEARQSFSSWMCAIHLERNRRSGRSSFTNGCMEALLAGAESKAIEESSPELAILYVKVIYALRCNVLYGENFVRPFLSGGSIYYALQTFHPHSAPPILFGKYGYLLKLLLKDMSYEQQHNAANVLNVRPGSATVLSPTPVSVFLGLLSTTATAMTVTRKTISVDGRSIAVPAEGTNDVFGWVSAALSALPATPSVMDSEFYRGRYWQTNTLDGVGGFDIEAIAQEYAKRGPTPEQQFEFLKTFVQYNQCVLIFNSAITFFEGWVELVSFVATCVRGVTTTRLREVLRYLIDCVKMTDKLTTASARVITTAFARAMVVILTNMYRKVVENDEDNDDHFLSLTAGLGRQRPRDADSNTLRGGGGSARPLRPMDRTAASSSSVIAGSDGLVISQQQSFNTTSSLLNDSTRANMMAFEDVFSNQSLLHRLIELFIAFRGKSPSVRAELYTALTVLLSIPGVKVDDVAIQQRGAALFDCLVNDICEGAALVTTMPSNGNLGTTPVGTAVNSSGAASGNSDVSGSSEAARNAAQTAMNLLRLLVGGSPVLCHLFCSHESGVPFVVHSRAKRCFSELLRLIDDGAQLFAHSAAINSAANTMFQQLTWLVRDTFALLTMVSKNHSPHVLSAGLVEKCLNMRIWVDCVKLSLNHIAYGQRSSAAGTAYDAFGHSIMSDQWGTGGSTPGDRAPINALASSCLVLSRHFILGVVRWMNCMAKDKNVRQSPSFISLLQSLFERYEYVFAYVLTEAHSVTASALNPPTGGMAMSASAGASAPGFFSYSASRSSTGSDLPVGGQIGGGGSGTDAAGGSAATASTVLLLYSELTELIGAMTGAAAIAPCRALVEQFHLFAWMEQMLAGLAGQRSLAPQDDSAPPQAFASGGALMAIPASGGRALRYDLVAKAIRNVAGVLLRAEIGNGPDADAESESPYYRRPPSLCINNYHISLVNALRIMSDLIQSTGTTATLFRLSCYVSTLHALTCLVHYSMKDTRTGARESARNAERRLLQHLRSLPLDVIMSTLRDAREALYLLRDFNTDYSTGMRGLMVPACGWAVQARDTLSNQMAWDSNANTTSSTQSLSQALGASAASRPRFGNGNNEREANNNSNNSNASAAPTPPETPRQDSIGARGGSTPGVGAAPANALPSSSDKSYNGGAQDTYRPFKRHGVENGFTDRLASSSVLEDTTAIGAGVAQTRRKTAAAASEAKTHYVNPNNGVMGIRNIMVDSTSTENENLRRGLTLFEAAQMSEGTLLLASGPSTSASLAAPGTGSDATAVVAGGQSSALPALTLPSWTDVLSLEHDVRVAKIELANALQTAQCAINLIQSTSRVSF